MYLNRRFSDEGEEDSGFQDLRNIVAIFFSSFEAIPKQLDPYTTTLRKILY